MTKSKRNILVSSFLLLGFVFMQCQNRKTDNVSVEEQPGADTTVVRISYPVEIDKEAGYETKNDIFLQDIGEVTYLQLGTTDQSLLPDKRFFSGIYLTDADIFLSFGGNVYRFSSSGKFLNTIGKRGGGPAEFASVVLSDVSEASGEVFLLDYALRKIMVYDYDGKYKRSFRNEQYCDRFAVVNDSVAIGCMNEPVPGPRIFLSSLKDGKTIKVLLPERKVDCKKLMTNIGLFARVGRSQDRIILCSSTSDTIFAFNTQTMELEPRYVQRPLNTLLPEDAVKTVPYLQFETDKYACILMNDIPLPDFRYWVDRETGDILKVRLADKNKGSRVMEFGTNKPDVIVDLFATQELKELFGNNKLSGELKTIAEAMKEDDNPVLVLTKVHSSAR